MAWGALDWISHTNAPAPVIILHIEGRHVSWSFPPEHSRLSDPRSCRHCALHVYGLRPSKVAKLSAAYKRAGLTQLSRKVWLRYRGAALASVTMAALSFT